MGRDGKRWRETERVGERRKEKERDRERRKEKERERETERDREKRRETEGDSFAVHLNFAMLLFQPKEGKGPSGGDRYSGYAGLDLNYLH